MLDAPAILALVVYFNLKRYRRTIHQDAEHVVRVDRHVLAFVPERQAGVPLDMPPAPVQQALTLGYDVPLQPGYELVLKSAHLITDNVEFQLPPCRITAPVLPLAKALSHLLHSLCSFGSVITAPARSK